MTTELTISSSNATEDESQSEQQCQQNLMLIICAVAGMCNEIR
jgi:hypothetical protein